MKSCETISVVVKKINETCENQFEIEKTWKIDLKTWKTWKIQNLLIV